MLPAGYWPSTFWSENYWAENYWPKYGSILPTSPIKVLLVSGNMIIQVG